MSSQTTEPRVRIDVLLDEADRRSALHDATFWGLRSQPKELPAVWLYDDAGSRLFDADHPAAGVLPDRGRARDPRRPRRRDRDRNRRAHPGRARLRQLRQDATAARCARERRHARALRPARRRARRSSARAPRRLRRRYRSLAVHAIVGDFELHLPTLPPGEQRLIAFLGSTVGNLYPDRRHALFSAVAAACEPGDWFLLGVDLVKDPTADRGGLQRQQRRHRAVRAQRADGRRPRARAPASTSARSRSSRSGTRRGVDGHRLPFPRPSSPCRCGGLDVQVEFAAGERLRIEISTKFRIEGAERELAAAGLALSQVWTDSRQRFALLLAQPEL